MVSINRNLVALDILHQDMIEELEVLAKKQRQVVSETYVRLLKQYLALLETLAKLGDTLTESNFSDTMAKSEVCRHLVSKKMLRVNIRLIEYVIEYYDLSGKIREIKHIDFSHQADVRFDLLSTRAIKLKAQYKTIVRAMNEIDYRSFLMGVCLPEFDWGWKVLFEAG